MYTKHNVLYHQYNVFEKEYQTQKNPAFAGFFSVSGYGYGEKYLLPTH